jgi:hypothetical protein
MVLIFFVPIEEMGVMQERMAMPSWWTVQAPHRPAPQPNLAPVRSSISRSTQSRGMSGEASTVEDFPFTLRV